VAAVNLGVGKFTGFDIDETYVTESLKKLEDMIGVK
jgi:ribosomal protein L11 methylase PrmA